jgi:hypothetical protein
MSSPRLKLTETTTTRRVPCERARDETLCRRLLEGWQRHLVAARDKAAEKRERSCLQEKDGWGRRRRLQRAESRRGLRVEVRQDARRRRTDGAPASAAESREDLALVHSPRLGARALGANLAHDAARIERADKLGTGLAHCWS